MRAVAYLRVSDPSQVEGHSLEAQERLFRELCRARGWEAVGVYREEGRPAHSEAISKRPVFQRLLEDARRGAFEVAVVHTLDRWSRNLKVTIDTVSQLARHNVGLVSVTENIDWSNPQGRLFTQMLGAFAEYYSGALGAHVKKGVSQRALSGLHLGAVPFGYASCKGNDGQGRSPCDPEHPGGVHPVEKEAQAVREAFRRYATGTTTLSQLAAWLNNQGLRTRNMHKLPGSNGVATADPRLFTVASVRGMLHNAFYMGKVRHGDKLLPGAHETLVSQELFDAVQLALKRNAGRSETLHPRPEREYLLKGLIRCAHCGMPMWAQTYHNGHRYYREQFGSRGAGHCVGRSGSLPCHVPDGQVGRILEAVVLPQAWLDRVLAGVHAGDEAARIRTEREEVQGRLKRLGRTYIDGLTGDEDYRRERRLLEEKLARLVVPGVDAAQEAGKLLEDLLRLWREADLSERRRLLLTMLDGVYVDAVLQKSVVAIRPKPAFRALFAIPTAVGTREGSGVHLIMETPQEQPAPGAPALEGSVLPGKDAPRSVFLVETGESRTPRPKGSPPRDATGLSGIWLSPRRALPAKPPLASRCVS